MRVAIFTETFLPKVDGIVTVLRLLLDHLAERGVETRLFSPRLSPLQVYRGIPLITAPGVPFPFYPDLRLALPTPAVLRALRDFQPDVVHFVHPSVFGLVSYALVKRLNLPTLVSYHIDYGRVARHFRWGPLHGGFIDLPIGMLTRLVMNSADYGLAPSRAVQQRLAEIGVTAEVGLWRRGVDAERFHPRHASDAMRWRLSAGHPDATILLYVGRLSQEKQIDHIRAVLEQVPGTRLALAGQGPAQAALEKHFEGTPTVFMGHLEGDALAQAYASADIFVFPSAIESFGLVVIEALAAGLPVVAAQVGGVTDIIREGENGYTFVTGNVAGMVAGVQKIVADAAHQQALGTAARAFAETQSWPSMMDEVIAHYARLADASTRR